MFQAVFDIGHTIRSSHSNIFVVIKNNTKCFTFILFVKIFLIWSFSSVQLFSHVWLFATPWTASHQASLSITNSQRLLKHMSIKSVMPSNHIILYHPLLLLPSIFPSIRVFWVFFFIFSQWVSSLHQVAKVLELQLQHQSFWRIFRIDFLRFDCLDLLAVQGSLKCLLQYHSS